MNPLRIVDGRVELVDVTVRVERGRLIYVYPPGMAEGCFDLRNRGLDLPLDLEITCWPKRKTEYGKLTTGGHAPARPKFTAKELWRLAVLTDSEDRFQALLAGWKRAEEWRRGMIRVLRFNMNETPGRTRGKGVLKRSQAYEMAAKILEVV